MSDLTYDGYRMIFYIGLGLTILFLLVTVALFFVFRVPEIIGDLTGRTANKAIKEIRGNSEATGVSSGVSSSKKSKNKKSKNKATAAKQQKAPVMTGPETSVLGDVQGSETAVLMDGAPSSGQETAVLADVPAPQSGQETSVLGDVPPAAPAVVPAVTPAAPKQKPAEQPKAAVPPMPQPKKAEPVKAQPVPAEAKKAVEPKKSAAKAEKKKNSSTNGGSEKMYMPMNGNNGFMNSEETSELLDMAMPTQVEFYGPNDNGGSVPPYRVFVIEYDMTLAESTEIIP